MNNNCKPANIEYLIRLSKEQFGDNLLAIINSDCYIRQPCYSSNAQMQLLFIVHIADDTVIHRLNYLRGEFPEFIINYLSSEELPLYPAHGTWSILHSPRLYEQEDLDLSSRLKKQNDVEAISQAIIAVGHIARMYYLRNLNDKTHTWAVRQIGWALRYTEFGIVRLWNLLQGQDDKNLPISDDIAWLKETIKNWRAVEEALLLDVDSYQQLALRLSGITQYYAKAVSEQYSLKKYNETKTTSTDEQLPEEIQHFKAEMEKTFSVRLLSLYLSGSAARGDVHKTSDIDSIAVFEQLDDQTLVELKQVLKKFPKVSVYSLSIDDLSIYPDFRYYTLNLGTKKLSGSVEFASSTDNNHFHAAILNNLFTIKQITRHYRIQSLHGQRSVHLLILMMKLLDHGCLRLWQNMEICCFPDTKEEVKAHFVDDNIIQRIIDNVIGINEIREKVTNALLNGENKILLEHLTDCETQANHLLRKWYSHS